MVGFKVIFISSCLSICSTLVRKKIIHSLWSFNNDDNKEGGNESLKGSGYMRREIPRPLKLGAESLQPEGSGNSGESVVLCQSVLQGFRDPHLGEVPMPGRGGWGRWKTAKPQ